MSVLKLDDAPTTSPDDEAPVKRDIGRPRNNLKIEGKYAKERSARIPLGLKLNDAPTTSPDDEAPVKRDIGRPRNNLKIEEKCAKEMSGALARIPLGSEHRIQLS